jgi:hypothetical protein
VRFSAPVFYPFEVLYNHLRKLQRRLIVIREEERHRHARARFQVRLD